LNVGQGKLYFESAGQGEVLVLSHAAFLDSHMFDEVWETLAEHFHVIRYDMLGYGQSGVVTGPVCRRDHLRQLLMHLGVTQAHMVGCSMGGEIMLDTALETPELVSSLTLVGSTPSGFEMRGEPPRYLYEMFEAGQRGDIDRMSELQIRIWFDGNFREPDQVDVNLREKALRMNRTPAARQTFFIADMQPVNPLHPPAISRLTEVMIPTLVVVGDLDHPEVIRATEVMAAEIPNAQKVVMGGAAHVPSFEQPEQFNRVLLHFLHEKR
jgi:pimeloyl-ACP methyl ester carboxylesterase